jgi:hypothetical protein
LSTIIFRLLAVKQYAHRNDYYLIVIIRIIPSFFAYGFTGREDPWPSPARPGSPPAILELGVRLAAAGRRQGIS